MNIVYFTHSLRSDWNHGNAHFLRGVLSELQELGHEVTAWEPSQSGGARTLAADPRSRALESYQRQLAPLKTEVYNPETFACDEATEGADLVIVHERNDRELVSALGRARQTGRFRLLFHDTHHRAVSAPHEMAGFDLAHYDGVLAFGEVIRQRYLKNGWARQAWTWHEAADTRIFHPTDSRPLGEEGPAGDLVWIGNWGDEERRKELFEFLVEPAASLDLETTVHGVRYPAAARDALCTAGIEYGGYLPNFLVPQAFAAHTLTVHIPRRPYVESLPGIPTIRPFEALACGIPLISAPWNDCEELFRPGKDFVMVSDGAEMTLNLGILLNEPEMRAELAKNGLETIRARHTCAHRAHELLAVAAQLN